MEDREQECCEPSAETWQKVQQAKNNFLEGMQRLIKDDMWADLSSNDDSLFETLNDLKQLFYNAYPELYQQAQHDAIEEMLESAFTVEELEKYWDIPEDLKHA